MLDLSNPILHCFVPARISLKLLPKAPQRLWSPSSLLWSPSSLLWPLALTGTQSCLMAGGGISTHHQVSVILLQHREAEVALSKRTTASDFWWHHLGQKKKLATWIFIKKKT